MPKIVDHDERRRMIAAAVTDIAATDGLGDVSFRTVADRAGVSVSLVQHYFGDKANLLATTLRIQSEAMNASLASKLADLGDTADPIAVLRTVASAFLPVDDVSRRSMLVYQGFAAVALTDDSLRHSEMFADGRRLIDFFAGQLAQLRGDDRHAPEDATGLLSLVLGLSTAVLLTQISPSEAIAVLDRHIERLTS
jgi:TetR/AcrR family transcriptional regulator, transcriptional repressor of bet genes